MGRCSIAPQIFCRGLATIVVINYHAIATPSILHSPATFFLLFVTPEIVSFLSLPCLLVLLFEYTASRIKEAPHFAVQKEYILLGDIFSYSEYFKTTEVLTIAKVLWHLHEKTENYFIIDQDHDANKKRSYS